MTATRKPRPEYLTRDQVAEMIAEAVAVERERSEKVQESMRVSPAPPRSPLRIRTFPMRQAS
ncbi:MAG: hypothetical protein ACRYGP_16550 [Janthinobacterium lividum]